MIFRFGTAREAAQMIIKRPSTILIGSNFIALFARMVSSVILTRLLDAAAFGTAAIISTFSFVIVMLTDLGFYQYTVRSDRIDEEGFLDKVWTVRLNRDVIITIIFVLTSGLMAKYVRDPSLQLAFAVASLTLITDGMSSMAFATAAREGLLNRLSILDLIPVLAAIVVSIILAVLTRSYWALIISGVFGSILKMVLSYYMFPDSRRRIKFDKGVYLEIWRFGRFIVPSSIITLLLAQSDRFVLVRFFSIQQFGLYSLASTLSAAPSTLMSSYTARILYPVFSKPNGNKAGMSALFYKYGSKTRLLFIFLIGVFITSAPTVIAVLYDDRYLGASQYLSILLIAGAVNFLISTENEMLVAAGRVHWQMHINILKIAIYTISSLALYRAIGVIGLVWAIALTSIAVKIIMTVAMWYIGILRLKEEMKFMIAAFAGVILGVTITLVSKTIWVTVPLPFSGS
jgi:lipopolysaccharide exporter